MKSALIALTATLITVPALAQTSNHLTVEYYSGTDNSGYVLSCYDAYQEIGSDLYFICTMTNLALDDSDSVLMSEDMLVDYIVQVSEYAVNDGGDVILTSDQIDSPYDWLIQNGVNCTIEDCNQNVNPWN